MRGKVVEDLQLPPLDNRSTVLFIFSLLDPKRLYWYVVISIKIIAKKKVNWFRFSLQSRYLLLVFGGWLIRHRYTITWVKLFPKIRKLLAIAENKSAINFGAYPKLIAACVFIKNAT